MYKMRKNILKNRNEIIFIITFFHPYYKKYKFFIFIFYFHLHYVVLAFAQLMLPGTFFMESTLLCSLILSHSVFLLLLCVIYHIVTSALIFNKNGSNFKYIAILFFFYAFIQIIWKPFLGCMLNTTSLSK